MGKQILEKCLTPEPQSEQQMWTPLPLILAVLLDLITASPRR
jgi:hypothetical protein